MVVAVRGDRHMNAYTPKAQAEMTRHCNRTPEQAMQVALTALWTMFDGTYRRICDLAEQSGEPGRVSIARTDVARRYWRAGDQSYECSIGVNAILSVVDGTVHGGAFISTSRPYLSLFIVPAFEHG